MNNVHIVGLVKFILLGACVLLSACSAENFNRAGYESVKNYQCNEQMDNLNCRDNYPSYEEYQRQRTETPQ